jgi:RNA 2',3'-cyclic 3'-phosphodiesterase
MRTFIALDISNTSLLEGLQNELVTENKWNQQIIKPVRNDNLHFTIIFLGEIDSENIERIKTKLAELQFKPINITYLNIGVFPNLYSPRVVWVGVDKISGQQLISLSAKVISKISDIGFKSDKAFIPHLTLFRIRKRELDLKNTLSKYNGSTFGSDIITRLQLKQSIISQSGPIYSNIFTVDAK